MGAGHWLLQWGSPGTGGTPLSQDLSELRRPHAMELHRLDRILADLARPVLDADLIDSATRERLRSIGIVIGGTPARSILIQRVWDRKRALISRMASAGDLEPPPGA
jgi:hypothetical protein